MLKKLTTSLAAVGFVFAVGVPIAAACPGMKNKAAAEKKEVKKEKTVAKVKVKQKASNEKKTVVKKKVVKKVAKVVPK